MSPKFITTLFLLLFVASSHAVVDVYTFENEARRLRYMTFIDEMRCPKCQNQNLAGSSSQIAEDLRRELHRMIEEGRTDEEIVDFMVSRYGDFVLYRPKVQQNTLVLWGGPVLLALIAALVLGMIVRRRRVPKTSDEATLSDLERQRLSGMLASGDRAKPETTSR